MVSGFHPRLEQAALIRSFAGTFDFLRRFIPLLNRPGDPVGALEKSR